MISSNFYRIRIAIDMWLVSKANTNTSKIKENIKYELEWMIYNN
jgi:hypothetical protein